MTDLVKDEGVKSYTKNKYLALQARSESGGKKWYKEGSGRGKGTKHTKRK
jgi:hypothetical protein